MSGAINGTNHNWQRLETNQWGAHGGPAVTGFCCADCNTYFAHYYHNTPDIYKAMKEQGVPEECKHDIR